MQLLTDRSPEEEEKDDSPFLVPSVRHYDNVEFSRSDFRGHFEEKRRSQLDESSRFLNHALEKAHQQGMDIGGKDIRYEGSESAVNSSAICGTCTSDGGCGAG